MLKQLNNRFVAEVASGAGIFALLVALAFRFDLHARLDAYFEHRGSAILPDLLTAGMIAGLMGLVYTILRMRVLSDEIARRKDAELRSDWAAKHDALTGLYNRRGLSAVLEGFYSRDCSQNSYAMFGIDLDGFKKVNDLLGHEGGNAVLKVVADRLRSTPGNDYVFRLGGDEFLVACKVTPGFDAEAKGRELVEEISRPMDGGGATVDFGASVGVAIYPDHETDIELVIHYADCAMYEAKRAGKNRVVLFDQDMEDALQKRILLEAELKQGLKERSIKPYYQPLVDLRTNRIVGFEALARWEITPGRFVPPMEFIALAEETGMIVELTEQLFRLAVEEAMHWPSGMVLSFNLSPIQLGDRMLGLRLMKILGEFGMPPSRLEVEITETALMKDTETAYAVLADLMKSGIRIALDDFGTGYSSLSQLAGYRFDKIKIDRSFVSSLSDNDRQDKVVRAILALSNSLGAKTTAEGIEDPAQLELLRHLGCDVGQGFLFGKAIPAEQIPALISSMNDQGDARVA